MLLNDYATAEPDGINSFLERNYEGWRYRLNLLSEMRSTFKTLNSIPKEEQPTPGIFARWRGIGVDNYHNNRGIGKVLQSLAMAHV